jgi:glycine/D-amino acid oxidase-like deaminating enzyme
MTAILTEDFKAAPYWWDLAKPEPMKPASLDPTFDVAIVGSGYTGLHAALVLLRAGRSVVIFDSEDPGFGASRRNAGFLGRVLKQSFLDILKSKGEGTAIATYQELNTAYKTVFDFVKEEQINCFAVECGRFVGATSRQHYDTMAEELEVQKRYLGLDYWMVSKSDMLSEIGTDLYQGGAVVPDLGAIHPGLYHRGLLDRVISAGGVICGKTEVTDIERLAPTKFQIRAGGGSYHASHVVMATNGYTPRKFHWHSRRVIPFTGYMAATEILAPEVFRKAIPNGRTIIDSNMNIDFFRPAPNESRIIFGGATGSGLEDVNDIAAKMQAILARALPDLAAVKLSHVWSGQCAATFDMMPHMGCHDGVWYGMGYNFAGVPMGTHIGRKIAYNILGTAEAPSIFHTEKFPTMPFYTGSPWFVPAAMKFFDWKDRMATGR